MKNQLTKQPFQNAGDLKQAPKIASLRIRDKVYEILIPFKPGTFEHLGDIGIYEAATFVRTKSENSQDTSRRYITELQKFMVFMKHNNMKIRDIDTMFLMDYQHALQEPGEQLLNNLEVSFNSVSEETADQYMNPIRSFMKYLHTQGILAVNPSINVPTIGLKDTYAEDQVKAFTKDQWKAVMDTLSTMPENTPGQRNKAARLRFCIKFAYAMALRINEHKKLSQHEIIQKRGDFYLKIRGKGKRARTLGLSTVDEVAIHALTEYRRYLGLPSIPNGEPVPLLPTINPVIIKKKGPNKGTAINNKPISEDNWRDQFKQFIKYDVMSYLYGEEDNEEKSRIYNSEWSHLTPHSLRHTRITHLVDMKKDLLWVQKFAGHERLDTTSIYFTASL